MKTKKNTSQAILAAVEPVGKNQYELREWRTPRIIKKGTLHAVFDVAETLWPGHVRKQNGTRDKYIIMERS